MSKNNKSEYWYNRAVALNHAALTLYENEKKRNSGLLDPCYLLAGLSIEVIVKAILVDKHSKFDSKFSIHGLEKLLVAAEIKLEKSQIHTIRYFEEAILWLTKYPAPNKESKNSLDCLFKENSNIGKFRARSANKNVWPSKKNYLKIWDALELIYSAKYKNSKLNAVISADLNKI